MKKNNNSLENSYSQVWITDRAWVSGLAGAFAVVGCAGWYNVTQALQRGVYLFGSQLTSSRTDSILLALLVISVTMLLVEWVRLWLYSRQEKILSVHPKLHNKNVASFFLECLWHYILYLVLLWLVIQFFYTAGEYGFKNRARYYQPWFRFLQVLWDVYLWGGLPYVLVTRALKHDKTADKRDLAVFIEKQLKIVFLKLAAQKTSLKFDEDDKKTIRALLVKLFFTPLMTVFFFDQFPHLVNNLGYIWDGLFAAIGSGNYSHDRFNNDLFNVSITLIFSIDVALAWCGYVTSSRWVDNQTVSADPSMLGWVVCLICYPPFQMFLGLYYAAPGEREVLKFTNDYLITLFSVMMVLSYFVYMWATLCFGVRFSNLTHRGIIRKGPFAFIRHPAYASKNFAWWCVMFPAIVYNAFNTGVQLAIAQTFGLLLMTWVYYWRAITEEKHLSVDPDYQSYCEHVKYRFIPRVI